MKKHAFMKSTLCLLMALVCNVAWAQTATIEVSTNEDAPEHVYTLKSKNTRWMTSYTSLAKTEAKAGVFAFFDDNDASTTNAYKIYSVERQKWVSYTKLDSYGDGENKAILVDTKDDANAWHVATGTDCYHFSPYRTGGDVAGRYWNWYGGDSSNSDDNVNKTVGYYNQKTDNGSSWLLTEVSNYNFSQVVDLSCVLTDQSGYKYTSAYKGIAGRTKPAISGVVGYTCSGEAWEENVYKATINFPVPVQQNVMISPFNTNYIWYYVNNKKVKAIQTAPTLANKENYLWVIIPTLENNKFTFTIKNVATGEYIYTTSTTNDNHADGVITVSKTSTKFTLEENVQFKIIGQNLCLSARSSTSGEQWAGTHQGHNGTKNNVYLANAVTNYVLTDAAGTVYEGTYDGFTGVLPSIDGADGHSFTNKVWDGDTFRATINFPFPVSQEGGVTNATYIANWIKNNVTPKMWKAVIEDGVFNVKVYNPDVTQPVLSELNMWKWAIYPQFTDGAFSFLIKNIHAGKYIYADPTKDYDATSVKGHITLQKSGTAFEAVQNGNNVNFAYIANVDDVEKTLKLTTSSSGGNDVYLSSYTGSHEGNHISCPTLSAYTVTTDANGYAAIYTPKAVTIPSGLAAYSGRLNSARTTFILTQLSTAIPTETAVILKGDANTTYTFTAANNVAPIVNSLKGSAESVTAADAYTFNATDATFTKAGGNVAPYTAYLEVSGAVDVIATYEPEGLTTLDDIENWVLQIRGQRGFIYVNDNNLPAALNNADGDTSNDIPYDAVNDKHHFAVVKYNENYYLYNIGAKKFLARSGNDGVQLVDRPVEAITIEASGNATYPWIIKLGGAMINISNGDGHTNSIRIAGTSNPDEGARWALYKIAAFDNTEVQDYLNAVPGLNQVQNTALYYLRSKRGTLVYNSDNPNQLSSTVAYGNISKTSSAAEWAIIKNDDKYFFYSLEGKKFIGQNTAEAGKYPMQILPQFDVQIKESTDSDYPFVFSTDNYGAINHFNHGATPGVANWRGNDSQGGLRSLGDPGSVHQIIYVRDLTDEEIQAINDAFAVLNPQAGKEYVLYDATHKVFLDINNLATAPQQSDCEELATMNSEKQSLYITATGLSWKIHTTAEDTKYLGQYTADQRQWNSKVHEDQSQFAWTINPVLENGEIFVMLQNTSGTQNGFLGNAGHANGSALFVNQTAEEMKLKLILHEAALVYKVVTTETTGAAVYGGKNYVNGDYIFANAALTNADLVARRVPGKECTDIAIDEENKIVTLTYTIAANFKEGDKFFVKNRVHANDYIGVEFAGGKLDNTEEPTTKNLVHKTKNASNIDYKFCWELKATTHENEQCFYLYSPYCDWYIGSLRATNQHTYLSKTEGGAGKYKIEKEGDYLVFHCLTSNVVKDGLDCNFFHWYDGIDGAPIVGWTRSSTASQWLVEEVTEEMEAQWQNTLTSQYNTLTQHEIGTGVNQYSGMPESLVEGFNALSLPEEATAIEKARYCVYALYDYASAVEALVINQPTAGFYRIQSQNGNYGDRRGKYLQNTSVVNAEGNPQGLELRNAAGINSIMYIDESKTILSYASGQYLNDYTQQSTVGTEGTAWEIVENNSIKSKYALRRNGATTSNQYLSDWNSAERVMDGQNDASAAWTFEIVEALPFTFKSAGLGFATFNAPVAVELPEGVLAYVTQINLDNNTLQMYRLKDKVVPANTPVMLYCEAAKTEDATKELKIVYTYTGNEFNGFDDKKSFYGTIAAVTYPTDCTIYSLRKSAGKNTVGFYQKADGNLGGFKAWIKLDEESDAQGARTFTIIFDGDDATGLKEALGLENENVEIYDLSGRRLDKPTKGVNVVGGKLVIK